MAIAAFLSLAACQGHALSDKAIAATVGIDRDGPTGTWTGNGDDRSVVTTTVSSVQPDENVRLVSASLVSPSSAPAELLDVRASFGTQPHTKRVTVNGFPGYTCSKSWPLPGLGPTYPLPLDLMKGEAADVTVYWKARQAGSDAVLDGVTLSFEFADGSHHNLRITTMRAHLVNVGPEKSDCAHAPTGSIFERPFTVERQGPGAPQ